MLTREKLAVLKEEILILEKKKQNQTQTFPDLLICDGIYGEISFKNSTTCLCADIDPSRKSMIMTDAIFS